MNKTLNSILEDGYDNISPKRRLLSDYKTTWHKLADHNPHIYLKTAVGHNQRFC